MNEVNNIFDKIAEFVKKNWRTVLILVILLLYIYINRVSAPKLADNIATNIKSTVSLGSDYDANIKKLNIYNTDKVPNYAINTLIYIRNYGTGQTGFVWGRYFSNYQKVLPKWVAYTEWDVKKYKKWVNRGPERLVTSIQHAYYTSDHYKTFVQIQ
jgi:ribonuclease T1